VSATSTISVATITVSAVPRSISSANANAVENVTCTSCPGIWTREQLGDEDRRREDPQRRVRLVDQVGRRGRQRPREDGQPGDGHR
jgi:hypothetical protein